jgi:glycosyltransferase involved in cell wall biosynthesis
MKIVQLIFGTEGGGVLAVLDKIANYMAGIEFLALRPGRAVEHLSKTAKFIGILNHPLTLPNAARFTAQGIVQYLIKIPEMRHLGKEIADLLPRDKACLLHTHSLPMMLLANLIATRRVRETKVIYHFHSTMNLNRWLGFFPLIQRQLLVRRCAAIIAVSKAVATYWKGAPIPLFILYNAVEKHSPSIRPPFDAKRFSSETKHLLSVGTLIPDKGHYIALEALPQVLQNYSGPIHLWIAGGPFDQKNKYAQELVEKTKKLGLEDHITFLGHVSNLRDWHRFMWLGLQLRITPEPCSMWVLEAMQDGLPLVASSTGGTPELIRHEREALLVPPGDSSELAKGILRLAHDEPLYQKLKKSCEVRARHFDLTNFSKTLASIYSRIGEKHERDG